MNKILKKVMAVFLIVLTVEFLGKINVYASDHDEPQKVELNEAYLIEDLAGENYYNSSYYYLEINLPTDGRIRIKIQGDVNEFSDNYINAMKIAENPVENLWDSSEFFETDFVLENVETLTSKWVTVKEGTLYLVYPKNLARTGTRTKAIVEYQKNNQDYYGETEDNDTFDTANVIQAGKVYEGNYSKDSDKDIYKFQVTSASLVEVNLYNTKIGYVFYEEDENGNVRKIKQKESQKSRVRLPRGNYYITVYGVEDDEYSFGINIMPESANQFEQEWNNYSKEANHKELNTWYTGNLNDADDVDYYHFRIPQKSIVTLEVKVPRQSGDFLKVVLYDAKLKELQSFYSDGVNPYTKGENLTVNAGEYYVRVEADYYEDKDLEKDYQVRLSQQIKPIKLNKTKASLKAGASLKLKLSEASGKIQWTSSKPSIATVSANGTVKAKKIGTAVITANYQGKTYSCQVNVKSQFTKGTWYAYSNGGFYFKIKKVSGRKIWITSRMPKRTLSKVKATINTNGKKATVSVWCRKNKKHSLVINKIANGVKVQEKSSCQEKLLSASEREKKKTITQKFYTEKYWQSNY